MKYPVDRRIFGELASLRDRMVLENPNPDRVGIARPFVPWIGEDLLAGSPGIYFVGIATRGSCDELRDFKSAREFAKTWAMEISTPFWQYIREVIIDVYDREYLKCISRMAWTNQYKIGVFNRIGPTSRNPEGFYADIQSKLCEKIMKREFQLASASAIVVLGSGALMDRLLRDREEWDTEQYKKWGMWTRDLPGGSPVFYQYHPGWLRRQGAHHFQEHARMLARALRGWLVEQRRVLMVAHADRNENVRIISARKTTQRERKHYKEKN